MQGKSMEGSISSKSSNWSWAPGPLLQFRKWQKQGPIPSFPSRILSPPPTVKIKILAFPESLVEAFKHDPYKNGTSSPKVVKPFSKDDPEDLLSSVPVDRDITLKELIESGDIFEVFEVEDDCGVMDCEFVSGCAHAA